MAVHILSRNGFINTLFGDITLFPDCKTIPFEKQRDMSYRQKIPFTISKHHFAIIQMLECCFCGKKSSNTNTNCVDTIYPSQGYTETNCISLCRTCVSFRSGIDVNEFIYKLLLSCNKICSFSTFSLLSNSFININKNKVQNALKTKIIITQQKTKYIPPHMR